MVPGQRPLVTAAIVPAAGRGERLGPGTPKALRLLGGAPLLVHAVRSLARARRHRRGWQATELPRSLSRRPTAATSLSLSASAVRVTVPSRRCPGRAAATVRRQ